MRYSKQIKYSLDYHWGIFCEIWDMFTLRKYYWLVLGVLAMLCVVPCVAVQFTPPQAHYYMVEPVPAFDPTLSQDIITDYYWIIGQDPPYLWTFNYYWVNGSGFKSMANVLCIVSIGLLMVAYVREKQGPP